jgi:hypothetical protein
MNYLSVVGLVVINYGVRCRSSKNPTVLPT